MSLFGTSPDETSTEVNPSRLSKSSLFDDEPSHSQSGSALFADDNHGGDSPWDMPTPKRGGRQNLVKNLLPASDVPDSYINGFDLVLDSSGRGGAGVGLTTTRQILASSGLTAANQAKILNLVLPGGQEASSEGLGRNEFNVLLALIGLAQEGEEITFDAVDERRNKLPQPKISYLDELRHSNAEPASTTQQPGETQQPGSQQQPVHARPRQTSFGTPEADPWGSPDLHRGHSHISTHESTLNGFGSVRSSTNGWGTATSAATANESQSTVQSNGQGPPSSSGSGWGGYNNTSQTAPFGSTAQPGFEAFPQPGNAQEGIDPQGRSLGGGRVTGPGAEEVVTVTLLPEKEGLFMFQHRNYEVKSARRGSSVVRRYSDFVWLLDCLHKRYPFRQLPLLPPKRVAADSNSFLEKRRRGLVRFTNALVRHPVLNQEQLVVMFLTVPTELSVWRKQATISVQEEFAGKTLPPDLEDSLPSTLNETFDTVRSGVKRSAEIFINLCALLERLAKRNEGLAADHLRFSLALQSLTEATKNTYAVDTNDVPLLNEGINATARHLSVSQSLLEDEARAWTDGVLEDLKQQRDCVVSMRDLFDRRDRLAKDNIPQLEKRIETNERKLQDLRSRPQGTVKPGEIEKIEESIFKDKESIVQQHARGVFIKECIRDELLYFQHSQYHISRLHQDWSQERVKYAELQADNWRGLSEEVEGMPTGE
ncbi:sorting nexin Mvp1 [Talaromyces stipitatus ATCC 10500]|uniref:Sorting nexin MVP1 n=1 Tax=Talaromyces stipitatus (strain ATCC 10500 / CBS 375.48 / QM 6759 / NRRL 1006) TaxID=441959 RepID=B8LYB9_TALSN|nr:sorting nexin Mvp1 [Talaromyces stipitatus ATCC 10500]EED22847.1 sorting nexin Mvp1 [Talaromyces stipitatus ATCC 10500]